MSVFYREFALADKGYDVPRRNLGRVTDQLAEIIEQFPLLTRILRAGVLLAQDMYANHDFRQFRFGIHTHSPPLILEEGASSRNGRRPVTVSFDRCGG